MIISRIIIIITDIYIIIIIIIIIIVIRNEAGDVAEISSSFDVDELMSYLSDFHIEYIKEDNNIQFEINRSIVENVEVIIIIII